MVENILLALLEMSDVLPVLALRLSSIGENLQSDEVEILVNKKSNEIRKMG